jgi:hypothetical protein
MCMIFSEKQGSAQERSRSTHNQQTITTMKNIPDKIYLQIDADGEVPEDFNELQVTWAASKVHNTDLEYVRPLLPTKTDEKEAEKYADEVVGKPTCTRDKLEWNDVRNSFLAGILHERASGKGWVKISDGLPLDRQKILFVLDNGETRMGSFIKKDQWDRVNMFCDGSFFTSGSVAYWMTVPEKPKENVDKASQ